MKHQVSNRRSAFTAARPGLWLLALLALAGSFEGRSAGDPEAAPELKLVRIESSLPAQARLPGSTQLPPLHTLETQD